MKVQTIFRAGEQRKRDNVMYGEPKSEVLVFLRLTFTILTRSTKIRLLGTPDYIVTLRVWGWQVL